MAFAPSEPISGGGGGLASLFQNPEFLSLLAGMGAKMGGPGSVGEAIGAPTQQMIQSRAMRETLGEQERAGKEWRDMLTKIIMGVTPAGEPGINTAKVSDKGLMLDIAGPTAPIGGGAAGAAGLPAGGYPYDFSTGGIAPTGAPTGAAPTPAKRRLDISKVLPFS